MLNIKKLSSFDLCNVLNSKYKIPSRLNMKNSMESLIQHFKIMSEGFYIPKNDIYIATEAPKGEFGISLISNETNFPFRCKFKAPGFNHLQNLNFLSKGYLIADLVTIMGSLDIVFGEIDR